MKLAVKDKDIIKIINFAKLIGLQNICFNTNIKGNLDPKSIALYSPASQTIVLPTEFDEDTLKYSLLHELGHYIIDIGDRFQMFWHINSNLEKPEQSSEKDLNEEYLAWENGEMVAKMLGIRLGAGYRKLKEECLKSHNSKYKQQRK